MTDVPKSTQDRLGIILSGWRNRVVSREVRPPLLDIACGLNVLARQFDGSVGIDIQDYGTTDRVVEDFTKIPFPDKSFRTITIVASLNYFDDPVGVLRECARLLTDDGQVVLTLLDPAVGRQWHRFREPWAKRPGFTSSSVDEMAAQVGLNVVRRSRFMLGLNWLYVLKKETAKQ